MVKPVQYEAGCGELSFRLAAVSDGSEALSPGERLHLQSCLPCQVEAARYHRLRRDLGELRQQDVAPDREFLTDLLATFGADATVHRLRGRSHRRAYLGGLVAAATAALAGAVVVVSKSGIRSAIAG